MSHFQFPQEHPLPRGWVDNAEKMLAGYARNAGATLAMATLDGAVEEALTNPPQLDRLDERQARRMAIHAADIRITAAILKATEPVRR